MAQLVGAQEVPLLQWQERASVGDLELVLDDLRSVEDPDAGTLRLWAWLEGCTGNHESAVRVFDRLLALDARDRDAKKRRADALWSQGRVVAALAEYQDLYASELQPEQKTALGVPLNQLKLQAGEQRSLRASMSRLHRWYLGSAILALLLLVLGAVSSVRLWMRG